MSRIERFIRRLWGTRKAKCQIGRRIRLVWDSSSKHAEYYGELSKELEGKERDPRLRIYHPRPE